MRGALLAAALVPLAAFVARRSSAPAEAPQGDVLPGLSVENIAEEVGRSFSPEPAADQLAQQSANVQAFLRMIRHAEGTADPDGYRALFGHRSNSPRLFDGFADHPRQAVQFTDRAGRTLWTTAAGAYQLLAVSPLPGGGRTRMDTWDRLKRKLGLPDFSPASQDTAAIELIDESGALDDVSAGRFEAAVFKVRKVWASMPGAGYAQAERTLAELQRIYEINGGAVA